MPEALLIVYCTVPDAVTGAHIAKTLVKERLCACVNRIPGLTSHYIYEEEYCEDSEELLLIKTTVEGFDALRERIEALHPYDTPEIIATKIEKGSEAYLTWLRSGVK